MVTGDLLVLSRAVLHYPAGYIFIFVSRMLDQFTVIDNHGYFIYLWEEEVRHVLSR